MKHVFKINSIPKHVSASFNGMSFGQQIEYFKKFKEFQNRNDVKTTHFDQKRKTFEKGLKEFRKLYNVTEFYCINRNNADWKDDSTEIWYVS